MPLLRIARVLLRGEEEQGTIRPASSSCSPPIRRTENTSLPRKPTFDFEENYQEIELDDTEQGGGEGGGVVGGPVLLVYEYSPAASAPLTADKGTRTKYSFIHPHTHSLTHTLTDRCYLTHARVVSNKVPSVFASKWQPGSCKVRAQ